jgi:hypothetical protein
VWQIENSTTSNAGDTSAAVALASAMVETFPASTVSSAAPPSPAPAAETSSLCDRVNVAISSSKIERRKNPPNSRQRLGPANLNLI